MCQGKQKLVNVNSRLSYFLMTCLNELLLLHTVKQVKCSFSWKFHCVYMILDFLITAQCSIDLPTNYYISLCIEILHNSYNSIHSKARSLIILWSFIAVIIRFTYDLSEILKWEYKRQGLSTHSSPKCINFCEISTPKWFTKNFIGAGGALW